MRLCFITVRREPDVPSPLLVEVSRQLGQAGHVVTHVRAEEMTLEATSPVSEEQPHGLFLLKSHTELALSVAGTLHDRGARMLNPYPACVMAQDKVRATQSLHRAGVPVPSTRVVAGHASAAALFAGSPLVVKPVRGHRGAGVCFVRSEADLVGWSERPDTDGGLVVQSLVDGRGEDLKVYVVGHRVWAVRKSFDPTSFTRPGRPVRVEREVVEIAARTARATGLSLFGIDVIESATGPVVVDLNYFPGYKGCVGVAEPMARHIHQYASDVRPDSGSTARTVERTPRPAEIS